MIAAENRIEPWVIGAGNCGRLKKETGENPVRTRRCKGGARATCHWETGKAARAVMPKPEDLPGADHSATSAWLVNERSVL